MKSLKTLLKPCRLKKNVRFLHYYPTKGKEFNPIEEPQKLGPYYKYVYNDDLIPETFQYQDEVGKKDPYIEANFYDWDNMQEKFFMEFSEMSSNTLKFLTLAFFMSMIFSFCYYDKKRLSEGKTKAWRLKYVRHSEPWNFRTERY